MFFGLGKKDKTKVAEGKESNNEALKEVKKLKVVVEVGDFIIKDNSIQEALGGRFFAEMKKDTLHLNSDAECFISSSFGSQVIIGNNNNQSGRSVSYADKMTNTFVQQSGKGHIQSVQNLSGCSIQKSNGVEVRNYGGKKIEINTTRDIPIYINGKLVESTKDDSNQKEIDDESIEKFPLDGYCVSDIVIDGEGSMIATDEHSYCNMPALIVKGSGDIVFEHQKEKNEFEGLACFVKGSGDIEVKNVETKNLEVEIKGSGDVKLVNVSGGKANFSINGSGNIVGRKVVFENKSKNIQGSGDIIGILTNEVEICY